VASNAAIAEDGPVRKRLVLRLEFAIPEGLTPDRRARSSATALLAVELEATLYAGLRRVDFAARVENRSRDHRLRVALRTPVRAAESLSDTAFGLVRRPLVPVEPPATEDICPTAPHRTFTAVEDGEFAAAVMSRGIYEIEARPEADGSTLLLTLLRCVGWLSRSDLATRRGAAGPEVETPGAQEQGTHRFEFAVTTYRGGYLEADLPGRAATYAFPPRLFATRAEAAGGRAMFLVQCDNPRVMFSTARPLPRSEGFLVRAWSVSPSPERARFSVGSGRDARLADLAGRALHGKKVVRRRGATLAVELEPFAIVTLRVSDGKNFPAAVKKR
jgi:2-O-(6-phospho-alpha-D-mannosyl)-D-glycerate hydrolase